MSKKYIRMDNFRHNGTEHFMRMQRTGDVFPQPARIIIAYRFWDDTGGWRGWETKNIYDRIFDDWDYAHAVYNEILRRTSTEGVTT